MSEQECDITPIDSTVAIPVYRYVLSKTSPRRFQSKDFNLEDAELSDSESELVLTHKTIWEQIQQETKEEELEKRALALDLSTEEDKPVHPEVAFLEEHIFPILLPVLTNTILAAESTNCLKNEKSLFNGIDFIAQSLYNCNPKYPGRKQRNQNILSMEWSKKILKEKKRPIYPKSYIWSQEEAAVVIQSYMRGHFIRKLEEVQEMRQFWKTLKKEKLEAETPKAVQKEQLIRMQYLR